MVNGTEVFEHSLNDLRNHPLFNKLDDETLESLLKEFRYDFWEKGTEYIDSTVTQRNFYVILKGRIKSFQIDPISGRELTLFILSKNDVFDVISLLDGDRHSINYKALDNAEVLSAPMDKVRTWIGQHPVIDRTLLPYLGQRMRLLESNLTDNVLLDIPTRLAKLILHNIDESAQEFQSINNLSNIEIASLIGSTRAVINRHIQVLKQEGIITTTKRHTQVMNIKALIKKIESGF